MSRTCAVQDIFRIPTIPVMSHPKALLDKPFGEIPSVTVLLL
jgi:hypothetical protein